MLPRVFIWPRVNLAWGKTVISWYVSFNFEHRVPKTPEERRHVLLPWQRWILTWPHRCAVSSTHHICSAPQTRGRLIHRRQAIPLNGGRGTCSIEGFNTQPISKLMEVTIQDSDVIFYGKMFVFYLTLLIVFTKLSPLTGSKALSSALDTKTEHLYLNIGVKHILCLQSIMLLTLFHSTVFRELESVFSISHKVTRNIWMRINSEAAPRTLELNKGSWFRERQRSGDLNRNCFYSHGNSFHRREEAFSWGYLHRHGLQRTTGLFCEWHAPFPWQLWTFLEFLETFNYGLRMLGSCRVLA